MVTWMVTPACAECRRSCKLASSTTLMVRCMRGSGRWWACRHRPLQSRLKRVLRRRRRRSRWCLQNRPGASGMGKVSAQAAFVREAWMISSVWCRPAGSPTLATGWIVHMHVFWYDGSCRQSVPDALPPQACTAAARMSTVASGWRTACRGAAGDMRQCWQLKCIPWPWLLCLATQARAEAACVPAGLPTHQAQSMKGSGLQTDTMAAGRTNGQMAGPTRWVREVKHCCLLRWLTAAVG